MPVSLDAKTADFSTIFVITRSDFLRVTEGDSQCKYDKVNLNNNYN